MILDDCLKSSDVIVKYELYLPHSHIREVIRQTVQTAIQNCKRSGGVFVYGSMFSVGEEMS